MNKVIPLIFLAALAACTDQDSSTATPEAAQKPIVIASNYPLFFFATEIAGDAVDVRFPEIDGDPALWAPGGEDVAELQQADLLIINGAGYESWLAFATLPSGLLLDTTAQVHENLLPVEEATLHKHGPEGEHSHQGTAFTTWLDMRLAIEQARAIEQGLSELVPRQSEIFRANLAHLESRLLELDEALAEIFTALGDQPLVFSHPVYQYLQHRYSINGRSVHWEPDAEPGTRGWIDINQLLLEHPARIMIWEDSPFPQVEEKLVGMGVRSVVFSPSGNHPEAGDFLEVMASNLATLKQAQGTEFSSLWTPHKMLYTPKPMPQPREPHRSAGPAIQGH